MLIPTFFHSQPPIRKSSLTHKCERPGQARQQGNQSSSSSQCGVIVLTYFWVDAKPSARTQRGAVSSHRLTCCCCPPTRFLLRCHAAPFRSLLLRRQTAAGLLEFTCDFRISPMRLMSVRPAELCCGLVAAWWQNHVSFFVSKIWLMLFMMLDMTCGNCGSQAKVHDWTHLELWSNKLIFSGKNMINHNFFIVVKVVENANWNNNKLFIN